MSTGACQKGEELDLFSKNATVVLVHGAWADGSSWNRVILPLLHQGLKVICAPIPLTSLSDDAAALSRVIERTDGPVLLAGHAYAGAVIAAYCLLSFVVILFSCFIEKQIRFPSLGSHACSPQNRSR